MPRASRFLLGTLVVCASAIGAEQTPTASSPPASAPTTPTETATAKVRLDLAVDSSRTAAQQAAASPAPPQPATSPLTTPFEPWQIMTTVLGVAILWTAVRLFEEASRNSRARGEAASKAAQDMWKALARDSAKTNVALDQIKANLDALSAGLQSAPPPAVIKRCIDELLKVVQALRS